MQGIPLLFPENLRRRNTFEMILLPGGGNE